MELVSENRFLLRFGFVGCFVTFWWGIENFKSGF